MPLHEHVEIENLFKPLLADEHPEIYSLYQHWRQFTMQYDFYGHVNNGKYFRFFKNQDEPKSIYQENKLIFSLKALSALYDHPDHNAEEIKSIILEGVAIELLKINIRQLRKLKSIQHLERGNIDNMVDELRLRRIAFRQKIKDKEFSKNLENNSDLAVAYNFLKHHEDKFHFGKSITTSHFISYSAVGTNAIVALFNFIYVNGTILLQKISAELSTLINPAINTSATIYSIFMGIPIVANILTAIPAIIDTVKSWFQHKSAPKKFVSTFSAAIGIAGIIASAVIFGLGAIAFSIVTMAAIALVGFFATVFYPWVRDQMKIAQTKKELDLVTERIAFLQQEKTIACLAEHEKDMLLCDIEKLCLSGHFSHEHPAIQDAISLVENASDVKQLANHYVVRHILQNKLLSQYLLEKNQAHSVRLNQSLQAYHHENVVKTLSMMNSGAAVLGLALLCFPPTMIAGIVLLCVTTMIGIGIKFNWGPKIIGFFKEKFGVKEGVAASGEQNDKTNPIIHSKLNIKKASLDVAQPKHDVENSANTPPLPALNDASKAEKAHPITNIPKRPR